MTASERAEDIRQTIHAFMCANRFHQIAIEAQLNRFGTHRTQHILLEYLSHSPSPPTQAEIARHFEISPAAVTVTLKKLEAAGLIQRQPQNGNSRANNILITQAGLDMLEQTHGRFNAVDEAMFHGITDHEIELLAHCLTQMQDNLRHFEPELENLPDCPTHPRQQRHHQKG